MDNGPLVFKQLLILCQIHDKGEKVEEAFFFSQDTEWQCFMF